ncbi:MAG TPA: hypothetical protein GX517_12405 [Alicyclobacillus sp.]|nr:hypothetical protein [Alicyclobacillus sp.]
MKIAKLSALFPGFFLATGVLFSQASHVSAAGVPFAINCTDFTENSVGGCFLGFDSYRPAYVGADQATAQTAASAAQQAAAAANNTVQYAQQAANAANAVNSIVNSTLTVNAGVVQDSSGTVLQAARQANSNAYNAWQSAQSANSKLDNVTNQLNQVQTNIQNINQYLPPTLNKISGLNGATATSNGSLQVVIDASNATQYSYKLDNGGWSSWMPIADAVSIPIPKGVHTLTVQVANGPVGKPGPAAKASMQVIGL